MTDDDRLALLVAIHKATRENGCAHERDIRGELGSRLPGVLLGAALRRLHGEGLLIPFVGKGWKLMPEGWSQMVNPLVRNLRPVGV